MGNSNSEFEEELTFEDRIEQAETDVLRLSQIPLKYIKRKYVTFEHGEEEGEQVSIRTFIIDDSEDPDNEGCEEKPTLVMVHGYGAATV